MILLVEDDVMIGRSLSQGLSAKGFAIQWVRRGAEVLAMIGQDMVTVLVLDIGLPDADGFDLCRRIRAAGHTLPILMLTARGSLDDRLEGFAAGADDYLPKPFAFAELAARVAVLAHRAAQLPPAPIIHGPLTVDPAREHVYWHGVALTLEPKPFALLARLARARGGLVSRQALIDSLWGEHAVVSGNTLDAVVSALRRQLAAPAPMIGIRAVKGQGFRLDVAENMGGELYFRSN